MTQTIATRRQWLGGAAALAGLAAAPRAAAQAAAAAPAAHSPSTPPPWATGPAAIAKAQETDPKRMGWMVGAPPPPDRIIRFADWNSFPQSRWSFSNLRSLVPTANVGRGPTAPRPFPVALRDDIDAMTFMPMEGSGFAGPISWRDSLLANFTDAIVVLHRGRIVYERSFGVATQVTPHLLMSVSKSFTGTIAASLIEEGVLDPAAPTTKYVPELAGSAFADATLRQVLDMTTGLDYSEDYTSAQSGIARFALAGGLASRPADYKGPDGFRAFLPSVVKSGAHGEGFAYKTVNTDVLAWIVHRATGKSIPEQVQDRYWTRLGQDSAGYFVLDPVGVAFAGGGFNASVRDIARFGEMMRLGGRWQGKQLVPAAVVADIARGGDRAHFAKAQYKRLPGWSYRSQWWVSGHGPYTARGVNGQMIWIDPKAEMVIARTASHPLASNTNFDGTSLPAWDALAKLLMRG